MADDLPKVSAFGAKLEAWRAGWQRTNGEQTTWADLAAAVGTDAGTLGQIRKGTRRCPDKLAKKLAKVLGVPLGEVRGAAGHGSPAVVAPAPEPYPARVARLAAAAQEAYRTIATNALYLLAPRDLYMWGFAIRGEQPNDAALTALEAKIRAGDVETIQRLAMAARGPAV